MVVPRSAPKKGHSLADLEGGTSGRKEAANLLTPVAGESVERMSSGQVTKNKYLKWPLVLFRKVIKQTLVNCETAKHTKKKTMKTL